MHPQRVLIAIPTFNEEKRIGTLLDDLLKIKNNNDAIVVIDDGSYDNTVAIVKKRNIEVISHKKNQGKGRAIKTGFEYFLTTNFQYLVFMDGDGQHSPNDLWKFIKFFESNDEIDIIVASRFQETSWKYNMPFKRKLSNILSRFGLWILFKGFYIQDPQNGFRGYTRKVVSDLKFSSNGYEAETELLILSYYLNHKIGVVPIKSIYWEHNRSSKFSVIRDTWKIPGIMFRLFLNRPIP